MMRETSNIVDEERRVAQSAWHNHLRRLLQGIDFRSFRIIILSWRPLRLPICSANRLNRQAEHHTDLTLVPIQPSPKDLRSAFSTISHLQRTGGDYAAVLMVANPRARITAEAQALLARHRIRHHPQTLLRRTVYPQSAMDGRTPLDLEPAGKAAAELRALVDWIGERLARASAGILDDSPQDTATESSRHDEESPEPPR
jgi:cellulose biosynthesis protein BcsQ